MLSIAKLTANRNNAKRSSGPRTAEGLRRSSQNNLRHGFTATSVVVIDGVEDPAEYAVLLDAILDDLDARGPIETLLAERIAQLFWRLRRVLRFETERLSHSQRELMPFLSDLDTMMQERIERNRRLAALGNLFLPGDHILSAEVVETILDACVAVLAESERAIFLDGVNAAREALGADEPTVEAVSWMIRRGEASLQATGTAKSNVPALAYEQIAGVQRAWAFSERSGDVGRERQRTEALMLEVERAGIIEKYEPRLRRDLSRTLQDLLDLQARRARCVDALNSLSSDEPTTTVRLEAVPAAKGVGRHGIP